MTIDFDILPEIALYVLVLGLIYFGIYRFYIYALVDILFLFVLTTVFASVLVIMALQENYQIAHFFICQICVFLGFAWMQHKTGNPARSTDLEKVPQFDNELLLRYTIYILFILYILSNIVLLYTKGFALLSDVPTKAKVTNFQGGFGLLRKINTSVGGVASAGLTFLYLNRSRRSDLILLITMILVNALDGSKGALFRYAICFGAFMYHPAFSNRRKLKERIKRLAPIALLSVLGLVVVVLYKESSNNEEVLFKLVKRLLYGSDALLFFYNDPNTDYFSHFSALDYPSYIANPVLGFFRLAPYQEALGNIMVENSLPPGVEMDVIVGPNSAFYTEGQIFFGFYGAFVYSFLLGTLASYLRSWYFSCVKGSAFFIVFLSTVYQFSFAVLIDLKVFITQTFDAILFVLPIYVTVCLIVKGRIIIRLPLFLLSRKITRYNA